MSIADDFFQELTTLYGAIDKAYRRLSGLQSVYDKKISEIYHKIEGSDFDVVGGYDYAKELRKTLQERRAVKDEFNRIHAVHVHLRKSVPEIDKQYKQTVAKGYEVRQSLNSTLPIEEVLTGIAD